jgi:hypothetical protein
MLAAIADRGGARIIAHVAERQKKRGVSGVAKPLKRGFNRRYRTLVAESDGDSA